MLQPRAAINRWRTPCFPSPAVSPPMRVKSSTMIKPQRTSCNRSAGFRYLLTNRVLDSGRANLDSPDVSFSNLSFCILVLRRVGGERFDLVRIESDAGHCA